MASLCWALQTSTAWDSLLPCTFSQSWCGSHTANRMLMCFPLLGIAPKGQEDANGSVRRVSKHRESSWYIYGLANNELCPAYEFVLLVMLQLVHGNCKDRFCMWWCFSIQDISWILKPFWQNDDGFFGDWGMNKWVISASHALGNCVHHVRGKKITLLFISKWIIMLPLSPFFPLLPPPPLGK